MLFRSVKHYMRRITFIDNVIMFVGLNEPTVYSEERTKIHFYTEHLSANQKWAFMRALLCNSNTMQRLWKCVEKQNQVIWELTAAPVILRDERGLARQACGSASESARPVPHWNGAHWHSPHPLGKKLGLGQGRQDWHNKIMMTGSQLIYAAAYWKRARTGFWEGGADVVGRARSWW